MEKLDPKAVRYANERLWHDYPELKRRQLVMPQDEAYAEKWMQNYKAYKQAQLAPLPPAQPAAPKSAVVPVGAPNPSVLPCGASKPCGAGSTACKDALEKGVEKDGDPIPPDVHARIKETNEAIRSRMKQAKFLGYEKAVDALDHWFNGCGTFKEMPPDKSEDTKKEAWDRHQTALKQKLAAGLKTKLAYDVARLGSADSLTVVMQWKGGGATSGLLWSDDNLAYFGATIHSRVTYDCVLVPQPASSTPPAARQICYECRAVEWKSWAEDNYDFESGKAVPGLPSDAQMNELAKYGCGANYQRSSKSWSSAPDELHQHVCFSNQADLLSAASRRFKMLQDEVAQEKAESARGALLSPGPAEEMQP